VRTSRGGCEKTARVHASVGLRRRNAQALSATHLAHAMHELKQPLAVVQLSDTNCTQASAVSTARQASRGSRARHAPAS